MIWISHFNEIGSYFMHEEHLATVTCVLFHQAALSGCFQADMNYRKISQCLVKINLHMILTGSKNKFKAVLNSGQVSEKPVTPLRKSAGNAGIVNLLQFTLETEILIVLRVASRALILAVLQARERTVVTFLCDNFSQFLPKSGDFVLSSANASSCNFFCFDCNINQMYLFPRCAV